MRCGMELVTCFNVRKNNSLRLLKWPKNWLILHFNFTLGKSTNLEKKVILKMYKVRNTVRILKVF